jgi:uncharacterized protein
VRITFDPAKRDKTLAERGLDFADAASVFAEPHFTLPDEREDYGEARFQTFGLLRQRVVVMVWTVRGDATRIISMRYANDRERVRFKARVGRSG